jgi:hypothetical protein
MSDHVQEFYQQAVRPLPAQERLRLAALILAEIAWPDRMPLSEQDRKDALDQLLRHAGAVRSSNPRSADNEQIDADLAREYGKDL